ncbi:MAG: rRNA maturation RNase YbeY [Gammaproteobacteria bacterium]|nr:MAG: rRNA maturation RNase YbeY [Gammaproteobacteria bacterium]
MRVPERRRRPGVQVELQRRVRSWSPTRRDLARWASVAAGSGASGRELGVCVVGAPESRRLNARFRGLDAPTNVLSFTSAALPRAPVGGARTLGELVICPRVLRAEARAQDKSLRAHWAHLVVHGTLHLLGYDHQRAAQARRMERREIAVLHRLGFANPYRSPG